jgi:hypothetical protein
LENRQPTSTASISCGFSWLQWLNFTSLRTQSLKELLATDAWIQHDSGARPGGKQARGVSTSARHKIVFCAHIRRALDCSRQAGRNGIGEIFDKIRSWHTLAAAAAAAAAAASTASAAAASTTSAGLCLRICEWEDAVPIPSRHIEGQTVWLLQVQPQLLFGKTRGNFRMWR